MRLSWTCFILGWGSYQPTRLPNGDAQFFIIHCIMNLYAAFIMPAWLMTVAFPCSSQRFTFWRDTVLGYHLPVGSSEEDRAKLWRAGRDAFVQATFDFIGLMPDMKKAMITAFQCNCRDQDEVPARPSEHRNNSTCHFFSCVTRE